jgi:hypothetical protein
MDSESSGRALLAVNDLLELLGLAQGAAERLEHEVHGSPYEMNELISHDLRRLQGLARQLRRDTENLVAREQHAASARGHPLRRASDRRVPSRPN